MDEWFQINDLIDFTNKARAVVYNNFGKWETPSFDAGKDVVTDINMREFDSIIPYEESLIIVKQNIKKQRNKKSKRIRYILNEELFMKIVHDLNTRMVSNVIGSLVNKGLVESGFDSEANDFIFWIKDNKNENKEKPETD